MAEKQIPHGRAVQSSRRGLPAVSAVTQREGLWGSSLDMGRISKQEVGYPHICVSQKRSYVETGTSQMCLLTEMRSWSSDYSCHTCRINEVKWTEWKTHVSFLNEDPGPIRRTGTIAGRWCGTLFCGSYDFM